MKFLISLVVFCLLLNCFVSAQTLIQNSCKKAAAGDPDFNYNFCVNSLLQDPESKAATNLKDLVLAATKKAAVKVTNIKGIVEQILKDKKYQSIEGELHDCIQFYDDANSYLKVALTSVKSHDYDTAKTKLTAAFDAPVNCEDDIKEGGKQSPITNENNSLSQTILIPFAFTNML